MKMKELQTSTIEKELRMSAVRASYTNYIVLKPSVNHIDCTILPTKEEKTDGKCNR